MGFDLFNILGEFLYPPPPRHNMYWEKCNNLEYVTSLMYIIGLSIFKIFLILMCSNAIHKIIRQRRGGGHELSRTIIRYTISGFLLRYWLPLRLLSPSLIYELGIALRRAIESLPEKIHEPIMSGLDRSSAFWVWLEVAVFALLLFFLMEAPLTQMLTQFGRWCVALDVSAVKRRRKAHKRSTIRDFRVLGEPVVGVGGRQILTNPQTSKETNLLKVAAQDVSEATDILENLVEKNIVGTETTEPKRIETTITTETKPLRRSSRKNK